ncbi:MAG: hypothetical protein ACXWDL_10185 [Nocardioides sp.]
MALLTLRLPSVLARVARYTRERGLGAVLGACGWWASAWLRGRWLPAHDPGSFDWDGRLVPYFSHRYHYTWLNERAVEIALVRELLDRHDGADVLEIGNVLGHYSAVTHTVVDKYEQASGVLNLDAADLELGRTFDLILAISTLEHVGLDEQTVDTAKPARTIARLKAHLKPGGILWVTHPVGYNTALDEQIRSGSIGFTRLRALRRSDSRNVWREVPVDEVWAARYDRLLYTAHGIVVGEFIAPDATAAEAGPSE